MKKIILFICYSIFFISSALTAQDFEISSVEFGTQTDIKEFLYLFKKDNSIKTVALTITDKKKLLFGYSVLAGETEIAKINDSTFFLIGSIIFPYADITASFKIGKHILKIKKSGLTIELDKTFSESPILHPITIQEILIKHNRMKQDSSFTKKDWEKITEENVDSVQNLSYDLMLGILNGCKECIPLFQNMRKDFDIINAGSISEDLKGCEFVLELYGYIKKE